jgi:hypothetical protein
LQNVCVRRNSTNAGIQYFYNLASNPASGANNYTGDLTVVQSCKAVTVDPTKTFGVYVKATVAVFGSLLAFLFY